MIILKIKKNKNCPSSKNIRGRRGFVLLFAVTLAAIILSIALGVSQVALKEINFSTSAKDANDAFFSADTGAECALFYDRSDQNKFTGSGSPVSCAGTLNIPVTLVSANKWTFNFSGLGSAAKGCASVIVDKATTPGKTSIVSKGYNTYNTIVGNCTPINNVSIERELDVNY